MLHFNYEIMNKYPKVDYVYDRRNVSSRTQAGTIEVRILLKGKRKYVSTGVKVLPNEWNKKDTIINNIDSHSLNLRIESVKKHIDKFINGLIVEDKEFVWDDLEVYLNLKDSSGNFIDYVDNNIDTKTNLGKRTRDNHRKLVTSLKSFGKIKTFKDLTPSNIDAYDKWLHQKDYKQSTIAGYHKFLKIYIHDAMRQELIEKDPYSGFKLDIGKPAIRKYLTPEELKKIEEAKLTPVYEKIRDIFLFQVYTGLAYVDLKKFDFTNVIERDSRYVIHDVRQKTGEDFYIVLMNPAINILKKFNYKLPLMTLEQYNMRLKIVAGAANLKKNLTSHMARHTYASIALNHGVPIEVLKEMMGHSDIRTTQVYAKMFNKTVESAYVMLEEKLKK